MNNCHYCLVFVCVCVCVKEASPDVKFYHRPWVSSHRWRVNATDAKVCVEVSSAKLTLKEVQISLLETLKAKWRERKGRDNE